MTISSDSSQAEIASQSEKIAAAMAAGTPLSCSISGTDSTESYTYVVQGKKFKMSNTLAAVDDKPATTTNVISDGEYAYTWSEPGTEGLKFKLPTEEEMKESADKTEKTQEALGNFPDLSDQEKLDEYEDQGYTVTCEETTIDAKAFIPPTTVTFQDMNAMMESSIKDATQGMTEEQKKEIEDAMKQYQQ